MHFWSTWLLFVVKINKFVSSLWSLTLDAPRTNYDLSTSFRRICLVNGDQIEVSSWNNLSRALKLGKFVIHHWVGTSLPRISINIAWPWKCDNFSANHQYHFLTTVHMHITDQSVKVASCRHKIRHGSLVLSQMPQRWHLMSWVIATAETVLKCLGRRKIE